MDEIEYIRKELNFHSEFRNRYFKIYPTRKLIELKIEDSNPLINIHEIYNLISTMLDIKFITFNIHNNMLLIGYHKVIIQNEL